MPRGRTVDAKALRRELLVEGLDLTFKELQEVERARPRRRADCAGGPRPCPWVGCRYHLALEAGTAKKGSLRFTWPDRELEGMPATCALDVAELGSKTLEQVGALLNLTRERVRQIEDRAIAKLKAENP